MPVGLAAIAVPDIFLEGMRRIFARSPFRIKHAVSSVDALFVAAPAAEEIAMVLVDGGSDANAADVARVRRSYPACRVVLLENNAGTEAPVLGDLADGVIPRHARAAVFVKGLELVLLGQRVLLACGAAPRTPSAPPPSPQPALGAMQVLSERETEVFHLLSAGQANKVIARKLGISEATVKMHVKSILRKTNSRNRTEAALLRTAGEWTTPH